VPEQETGRAGAAPRSLFITNDFPPRLGGAQSYYWGLIQTLDPADVVILAPAHPEGESFDATHPYHVVRAHTSVLWPTPHLERVAHDLVLDHEVAVIQLGHPLPAGLLGPRLKRSTGRPYLIFLGGAEVTLPAVVPGVGSLLRSVLGQASLLVTVSEYTAAAASRQVGGRVPAAVLRPALATDSFVPVAPAESAAAKAALGIDGDVIACVGRLVPRKGQDRLIAALALLSEEFPNAQLALLGGGRWMRRLRAQAEAAGVGERVHLPGPLTDAEMRVWLQASDLFASPCRSRWGGLEVEGFGLVFAEAALVGLPVIAGRSGGAPESVLGGESGIVVDGRSAAEVAAGLARLLRLSPAERRAMGARGRALALARHSPAVAGARYRELLRQAARG
jgi:phosphatidylinositol alpha-1,6-mannosyltransferase